MNGSETQLPLPKRLLAALFAVVLVVGLVPVSAWADNEEEQNSNNETPEQTDGADVTGGGADNADQSGTEPGYEVSLAGLGDDSSVVDDEIYRVWSYPKTFSNADMYDYLDDNFKWSYAPENITTYKLDGTAYLPGGGSGDFVAKNRGVCSYKVSRLKVVAFDEVGTLTLREVVKADFSGDAVYDGKDQRLDPKVTGANGDLVKGKDYTLEYSTNKNYIDAGSTITVKVDYIGDFSNENYYPDTYLTYTIAKAAAPTIDVSDCGYSAVYDGNYHGGAAKVDTLPDGTTATIEYSTDDEETWSTEVPQIKDVGKTQVKVRATNDNYETAYSSYTLEVTPADTMTVSCDGYTGTYDGKEHSATATAAVPDGSAATIEYSLDGVKWTKEAPAVKNVGKTEVKVRATNDNYETAYNSYALEVTPAQVTVTADEKSKTYGDADPKFTATVKGLVNGESEELIEYEVSRTNDDENADTYEGVIEATGEASQGNYSVTYVPADFTVNQAKVTVTADQKSKTYGDADPEFTAKVKGLVNDEPASLIDYKVSRPGAGEDEDADVYENAIVPTGERSQGNYSVEYVPADFTIEQVQITVTADEKSKTYGDADPKFTATVKGLVNGESEELIEYEVSRTNDDENADTYEGVIEATGDADQGNYYVTFAPADFTIAKRAIEVSDSATYEYNGKEQVLNIDAGKVTNLVDGDRLYLNNAQVKGTEPGTYAEVSDYTWDVVNNKVNVTDNYDLKVTGELTITKAANGSDSAVDNGNAGKGDKAKTSSTSPQTGDTTAPFAAVAGIVAIAAALAAFFVSRKLRRNGTR